MVFINSLIIWQHSIYLCVCFTEKQHTSDSGARRFPWISVVFIQVNGALDSLIQPT